MNNINKSLDEIASQRKTQNRNMNNQRRRRRRFQLNNRRQNFRRVNMNNNNQNNNNNFNRRNFRRDNRRRLYITNLNKSVTNDELKKLFQNYGRLNRCGVNFTQLGESKGTADVEFERHNDAVFAIRKLNRANINGRIVFVRFSNLRSLRSVRRNFRGNFRRRNNFRNNNNNNRRNFNPNNNQRKRRVFKRSLGRRRRF
jgi:RNA recognition motif-containing protein